LLNEAVCHTEGLPLGGRPRFWSAQRARLALQDPHWL